MLTVSIHVCTLESSESLAFKAWTCRGQDSGPGSVEYMSKHGPSSRSATTSEACTTESFPVSKQMSMP